MPPRSQTYEKRSKPSRPDREDKEQQRQERENAQRIAKQTRARLAKSLADSQKKALASAKESQPSGTSAQQRATKINNAVKTTSKSNMSPPILKPKSPTKFTISGGLIKGGTIYKDPITGSTLAGKETRMKAITDPQSVRVQDSRAVQTAGPKGFSRKGSLIDMTPDTAGPKGFTKKTPTPFMEKQIDIVNNLTNPEATKTDLLTGQPIEKIPTLLSDIRKKKNKRNLGGGNFMSQMIRTLLG